MSRRAGCAACGCLALVLLVSGCGIGPQDHPVSRGSAEPDWAPTAPVSAPGLRSDKLLVSVFLVRDGKLVPVWRASPQGENLTAILATLVQRPTRDELAEHLRTAIPANATRIRADIVDGVARMQVPSGFETLPNSERVLAVAQVLYTLTAELPVASLRLVKGKHDLDTPVGSGKLVSRPVTRSDFAALAPGVS